MNLPSGTLLQNERYQVMSKLGQGSFGITYLASVNLQITWSKKTRSFTSLCGALLIGMASYICDLFGGCNYDNMVWIIFAVLSVASSWCISICTAKNSK